MHRPPTPPSWARRPRPSRGAGRRPRAPSRSSIPVLQRGGRPRRRASSGSTPTSQSSLPVLVPRSRSRTTPAPTRRGPIAQELAAACPACSAVHLERKGRGRALRCRLAGERRGRRRLHGRRPLDRPRRAAAARRAAALRPQRRRDRQPADAARSRVVRGAKRELISRSYNLLLRTTLRARFSDAQCGFKAHPQRLRAPAPAARRGHRLVLRHRAAGARRAGRPAHPRGAGRLGRRPRQPRRHRRDRRRRPARHGPRRARARDRRAAARGRPPPARPRAARAARRRRAAGRCSARRCASAPIGVASTLAYLAPLPAAARRRSARRARTSSRCCSPPSLNTAANRRLTFGVRGRGHAAASQLEGLAVFGVGLGLTSGSLALLAAARAGRLAAARSSPCWSLANAARDPRPLPALPRAGSSTPPARLTTRPPRRPP